MFRFHVLFCFLDLSHGFLMFSPYQKMVLESFQMNRGIVRSSQYHRLDVRCACLVGPGGNPRSSVTQLPSSPQTARLHQPLNLTWIWMIWRNIDSNYRCLRMCCILYISCFQITRISFCTLILWTSIFEAKYSGLQRRSALASSVLLQFVGSGASETKHFSLWFEPVGTKWYMFISCSCMFQVSKSMFVRFSQDAHLSIF